MTDERYEELMCPQPSVVVRSLKDDPDYIKCPRCWHYTHEGLHNHDGLCDRCCNVLIEAWPDHESVPHIKARRASMSTFKETIEQLPEAERLKFFRSLLAVAEAGRQAGVPAEEWGNLYAKVCNEVEKNK